MNSEKKCCRVEVSEQSTANQILRETAIGQIQNGSGNYEYIELSTAISAMEKYAKKQSEVFRKGFEACQQVIIKSEERNKNQVKIIENYKSRFVKASNELERLRSKTS